jgi:hypothetical protein
VGGELAFAPTAADFAGTTPAIGAVGAAPGTTAGLAAPAEAAASSIAAPSQVLAGDPAISAALDTAAPDLTAVDTAAPAAETTQQFASAANPVVSDASAAGGAVQTPNVPAEVSSQYFAPGSATPSTPLAAGAAPADTTLASAVPNAAGSEVAASSDVPALAGDVGAGSQFAPSSSAIVDAAQAGGASAAAQPGLLSQLGSGLGGLGKIAANPFAQLAVPAGFLAYNALKGPAPIPPQAQQALQNAQANLGPLQGQATQNVPLFQKTAADDLNLANNFQVSPSQAAQLEIYRQNAKNALLQQIANQNPGGQTDPKSSSQYIQGAQQIDQQVLAQQTQMINQLITTAFNASSAANASLSTSANITSQYDNLFMQAAALQTQQDQAFQQALGSALQSFGLIAGLNAGNFAKMAA